MSRAFSVTLVPLTLNLDAGARETWRVFAICLPEPTGTQTPVDVLDQHPLLGATPFEIGFTPRGGTLTPLEATVSQPGDLKLLAGILRAADTPTNLRGLQARASVVGPAPKTTPEHFVDVDTLFETECRQHAQKVLSLLHAPDASGQGRRRPAQFASWDSYRARLARLDSQEWNKIKPQNDPLVDRYRTLLTPNPASTIKAQQAFSISQRELVMTLLQVPTLAQQTGLIVELHVTLPAGYPHASAAGVLSLAYDGQVQTQTHTQRRALKGGGFTVEPLSRNDAGTPTALLARLRTPGPSNTVLPAYRFYSFNLDHSIVRNVLAPSASDPGISRYSNQHADKGMQPFVGGSVTVTGPVEALVSQPAGIGTVACDVAQRVHCLESLWDGYRMDVGSKGPQAEHAFHSIHLQRRTFHYGVPAPIALPAVEDCIFRQQQVEGVSGPSVHPALYGWDGTATFESVPWASTASLPSELWSVDYVRDRQGTPASVLPRLVYREEYLFRLRNVFQGGLSLSVAEADQLSARLDSQDAEDFIDRHPHTRSRPFAAGAFHYPAGGQSATGQDTTLRVSEKNPKLDVWVYPAPLDREEARLHGLIRRSWEDKKRLACVESNLSAFLRASRYDPARGPVGYYADPDVTRVQLRAWTLGNPFLSTMPNPIVDRRLAENAGIVRSTDVGPEPIGAPIVLSLGAGGVFDRRPLRIRIRIAKSSRASLRSRVGRGQFDSVTIYVPRGDRVKVEVLPDVDPDVCARHTAWSQLVASSDALSLLASQDDTLRRVMPMLTTPLSFEAIHTVPRPRQKPTFERLLTRDGDDTQADLVNVTRRGNEAAVTLAAAVQVDPRTTGSVRLQARWRNFVDDPAFPEPRVVGDRSMHTSERSIYFGPALRLDEEVDDSQPLEASALAQRELASAELYSTERTVVFAPPGAVSEDRAATLEMGDLRHYRVEILAQGRSRFAQEYPEHPDPTARSGVHHVNVPAAMTLPAPVVSHVIPLTSAAGFERIDDRQVSHRRQRLRLYLHRPWCVSGEGEMLAVVFDRDWRLHNHRDAAEIPSPATAWGEDPLYRTYESETLDNLSPQVVERMLAPYVRGCAFDDAYPATLQGALSADGFNLLPGPNPASPEGQQDYRDAHLVAVRPSFDADQKLWYVDLDPGDRNRWMRLKLARFQPHAKPGFHVSSDVAFVNFLSTRVATLSAVRQVDVVEVMLDTIPYSGDPLGQPSLQADQRYRLLLTDRIGPDVFEPHAACATACHATAAPHRPISTVIPSAHHRQDRGNVRYVWKLPTAGWAVALIYDTFRTTVIGHVELRSLS